MHLKVFLKLKKNPKTLSSGQKNTQKTKKTHWARFKKKQKKRFFPTLLTRVGVYTAFLLLLICFFLLV